MHEPAITHIKICGITNLEDALFAARAGADLLGFILYERSPRYVSPASVRGIVRGLRVRWAEQPASQQTLPKLVGVFVNEPADSVARIMQYAGLDYAQLHGDETPDALRALAGCSYKAIRPQAQADDWEQWLQFAALGLQPGPSLLVDAFSSAAYGGTGHLADWSLAAAMAQRIPDMLLAGGLTPDNVTSALEAVRPWGVDVSSGVEASPGVKDHAAVAAFIANVRRFRDEAEPPPNE